MTDLQKLFSELAEKNNSTDVWEWAIEDRMQYNELRYASETENNNDTTWATSC